jgi:hypothetical protein
VNYHFKKLPDGSKWKPTPARRSRSGAIAKFSDLGIFEAHNR